MTLQSHDHAPLNFHVGPIFERFEDIRVGAAQKLSEIRNGKIGILRIKQQQYRILAEEDYQRVYGRALDAEILSKEVSLMIQAAVVVSETDTEAARTMLRMAAMQVKEKVRLVTLDGGQPVRPSDYDLSEFDGDISLNIPIK